MNAQNIWEAAYSQLELQLDRASFDTWLRPAVFLGYEDGEFTIGVHNSYARDMLQHRLYRNVCRVLSDVNGHPVRVRFEVFKPQREPAANDTDMPLFRMLAQHEPEVSETPLHSFVSQPERAELP